MTKTEYITPSGARVIVYDPKSADFQERVEKAVAEFMGKQK